MLTRDVFFKAVKTAAFALAVCVLAFGCGGDESDDEDVKKPAKMPIDNDLVGDWLVYDGVNEKGYITLTSSGELSEWALRKAGDIWIEGQGEGTATWGASRTLGEFYVSSSIWKDTMGYNVSGDFLITTACYDNSSAGPVCRLSELRRVDLASLRKNLGTVYTNDRNLYISSTYRDLMWYLQNKSDDVIDFDAIYFNKDGDRYGGSYSNGMWYTDGTKLVLLSVWYNLNVDDSGYIVEDDCEVKVLNRVELTYTVKANASLTLSVLGSSSADVWLPASYDDRNGYGAAKSRQGASVVKRSFSPLARMAGR